MNKKLIILWVLLALSVILTGCRADVNSTQATVPVSGEVEESTTEPAQTIEATEYTEASSPTSANQMPEQTEASDESGEMSDVEQPETEEEIGAEDLLALGTKNENVSSGEDNNPGNTPTEEEIPQSTEGAMEPTDATQATEEAQPDTPKPPNDGYSNNWY